jgi:hypothetical protein
MHRSSSTLKNINFMDHSLYSWSKFFFLKRLKKSVIMIIYKHTLEWQKMKITV